MKESIRKAIIYRYWHISIFLLVSIFTLVYYLLNNTFLPFSEVQVKGWAQVIALVVMLSPVTYLFSTYQKINETQDIKGINLAERSSLRAIISSRCSDLSYTIFLAFFITISIHIYVVWAQQDNVLISENSLKFFISSSVSYVSTSFFWIFTAFMAINELNNYKSLIQQRIDKEKRKEDFDKLVTNSKK